VVSKRVLLGRTGVLRGLSLVNALDPVARFYRTDKERVSTVIRATTRATLRHGARRQARGDADRSRAAGV
jgi:hypothetical protein